MGLSYSEFKRKAREHQVKFREEILCVEYNKYPNVLNFSDARKGLVFYEGFREEILAELKKPVPKTSSAPSGQMLTNLLRSEHIPYNVFFPMNKDLNGCKDLFNHILGKEEILRIEDIKIEHHPEPIENYLSDHTAFDVYISYTNTDNKECGIGIEVKYTEKNMHLRKARVNTLTSRMNTATHVCSVLILMPPIIVDISRRKCRTTFLSQTNSDRFGETTFLGHLWFSGVILNNSPALLYTLRLIYISTMMLCRNIMNY